MNAKQLVNKTNQANQANQVCFLVILFIYNFVGHAFLTYKYKFVFDLNMHC